MLRKPFKLDGTVIRAILYASALGVYELSINGERVGDRVLAPEWTDYHRRVQYQTYDVTHLLRSGENVIGATLADGWYAGRLGLSKFSPRGRGVYGPRPRLLAQLMIEQPRGETCCVCTDAQWRYTTAGPIRSADLLDGETHDLRRTPHGWRTPGFDDTGWHPVVVDRDINVALHAQPNEPIRVTEHLRPQQVWRREPGCDVFDMGQNMVGWCRLRVRGAAGATVRLRHAEALHDDGTLYRENLRIEKDHPFRGARQEDVFTLAGGADQLLEPRFTYHGFRYVEVRGLADTPAPDDLIGCVIHSDATRTGWFRCGDVMVNRLAEAIHWTQRGNMHSIPTDCPQRDERLGWTGDAQTFASTACFNMNMATFFDKWLRDLADAQTAAGEFPDFAPHPYPDSGEFYANAGWADAGVLVPWCAYTFYGDERLLARHYPAARRWIEFIYQHNRDGIRAHKRSRGLEYGDWLNAETVPALREKHGAGFADVDRELHATAFWAHSTECLARMARVLGHRDDAARYDSLARDIRTAFRHRYVDDTGRLLGDTQAAYALALHFDLLEPAKRPLAAAHLASRIKRDGHILTTGIQTTGRLMLELARWGYGVLAYTLLLNRAVPSWGHMIDHGATTIWERWDGYTDTHGFQGGDMNSLNHYAMGAVGAFLYQVIGGIVPDPAGPGFARVTVQPVPDKRLGWAQTDFDTVHGMLRTAWQWQDQNWHLTVEVPPYVTANVRVQSDAPRQVRMMAPHSQAPDDVSAHTDEPGEAMFTVQMGHYEFVSPLSEAPHHNDVPTTAGSRGTRA